MPISVARVAFLLLFAGLCTAPVRAQAVDGPTLEVSLLYWRPSASLRLASDGPGVPGTTIDLHSDLEVDDHAIPAFAFAVRPALRHAVRFEWIPIRYTSSVAVPRDLAFTGVTYARGEVVASTFAWTAINLGYEYDFVAAPGTAVGVVVEAKATSVRQRLAGVSADRTRRTSVPAPAIGAVLRVAVSPRLTIYGEFRGFVIPDRADGHYGGRYVDVDGGATIHLAHHLGARAGLRWLNIRHLGESDSARMSLPGIYGGIVAQWTPSP